MFTGIIESLGRVKKIEKEGSNVHFEISSTISKELKIDQSLAHNGVCLTVVQQDIDSHVVTAVEETLIRSNLGELKEGDSVNLERAMQANARLDGHMVQGHVDKTGICTAVQTLEGSWYFTFEYEASPEHLLVDKGSICINGVSLTVISPSELKDQNGVARTQFSVTIIPYTFEHTTFNTLKEGDTVNLEFDVIGKYISRYMAVYSK